MGGDNMFEKSRFGKSRGLILTLACVAILAGGCNESTPVAKADSGAFDASRLPRVSGAKEVFASPATTIFTSPDPVAQTADNLDKALAAGGWQKYVAPNTAYTNDPNMRTMSLKKGTQALNVFITIAPAQNNATSVQYSALPLKTDLPFTKDASNIEYSPERALLSLVTAESIDRTLDFYRKEMTTRGWAIWSDKTNGKQAADEPSGTVHERGAYAHYITDQNPSVTIVLTVLKAEDGKSKVEMKQWPIGILADLHTVYVNSDNHDVALADVAKLPRLEGAKDDAGRSAKDKAVYTVPGTLADTTAALVKLLGADGWKPYVAPMDERHSTLMTFKKGAQALSVSFTIQPGKNERTSEVTTVYYSPARLQFALAVSDDAADLVFDTNRPYLALTTAGTVDATRDFYNKQLNAAGWSPLSAADATAKWPNAKLDANAAYYDRGNKRPIMLTTQRGGDKTNVEIRVAPFALAQDLQADSEVFGLPRPKLSKSSGGTDGRPREAFAHVTADVGTVLAFYRRELGARNWKEETRGAIITPDEVVLNFSPPEGSAVLKLSRKYDLTIATIVQEIPKTAPKSEPVISAAPSGNDSIDAMMRQAQQMVRDATADAMTGTKAPQKMAQAEPAEALRPLAGNDAPVPVPENAEDVEFDGGDGKLEFSSPSSLKSVADFYRSTMKQQGWGTQSSVINNANMVVLNFSKGGKAVSFTLMKMGPKTNVTADGAALKVAGAKPAAGKTAAADSASQPATEDDLIVEESGGLPIPKRHTMAVGDKSPFRRSVTANVPLDLKIVLEFYRRELTKLNWKEESKGAVVAADNATLAFSSAEGPATLKLSRKDNETVVDLATKDAGAAAKAGVLPKPGQAKVLVTNPNDAEAAITINKQTYKVAAGGGTKGPDGAMIDLPPGKHKFSTKLPGKPASNGEVEVGADQTWGVLIGPGGALSLQVY
ncbi:MAG TPA: hypothetical protein VK522_14615 [Pseudolabrys sp.]|nr:hypothetical protein [Pseudolabrys sp.]